ncbi:MAG: hypothetical protein JNM27_14020 [Leptospirales bacterium]|nr:hypothetical protein [Leptospirales bacterium]
MKQKLFWSGVFLLTGILAGAEPKALTYAEAIRLSLAYAPEIKLAQGEIAPAQKRTTRPIFSHPIQNLKQLTLLEARRTRPHSASRPLRF